MKYSRFLLSSFLALSFFFGAGSFLFDEKVLVVLAAEDAGGSSDPADNGDGVSVNDCTGGQCGVETYEIDPCSASGTQCYSAQYCTEYNTPRFSSPLRVTVQAGQSLSYEVKVTQVNSNPSRDLAPWEHPLIQERRPFEAGWFGANFTSADNAGLAGSGLAANPSSVMVQKKAGVPQVPDSTGLIISGVPTTPGTYSVPLTTRNDLEEWIFEASGGDNQSSTFAGNSSDGERVGRSASCSRADVLEIEVTPAMCPTTAPEITSSGAVPGVVGENFSYQATANNYTTLGMSCSSLPVGTSWTGPLSIGGVPTAAGPYSCTIQAENSAPGCTPLATSKNVAITVAPASVCATSTPTITSSGSVGGVIGGSFGGYTIQTLRPADTYRIEPSSGDTSFPASLVVVNSGRSLEGVLAASQPKQQYHFRVTAIKNLPDGTSCPATKDVTIGLSCPGNQPNWNPESGQCTDQPVVRSCTDQSALNYGQAGDCRYGAIRCNDPLALNGGALGACTYSVGRSLCTDPTAINFGLTGSCQPRTSCGVGETGRFPSCQEIACPNCGQTKMCNVCVDTNDAGACTRHEMQPAAEAKSAPNSCGVTRSLYYCPDESSDAPPPPGEQACALAVTALLPERELIQAGSQCTLPWRVSSVPPEQAQFLRCVISGPDLSVRANGSSGQVLTPPVSVQSLYRFVCRVGDANVSNTASFTCRVSPRFQER